MDLYVLINIPINVQNLWFLPFEQYPLVREEMAAIVSHRTRSGYPITSNKALHNHYVVLRDEEEILIPEESGVVVDFLVPEEWKRREELWYKDGSDNIRDYIKAAAKYLNIEIRYRPEAAGWYRKLLQSSKKAKEKVGQPQPNETKGYAS
jgi:hypothetical protein